MGQLTVMFTRKQDFETGLPGPLYNVSECSSIEVLHHHPQLVLHQVAVMELNNVVVGMISHQYYLYQQSGGGGGGGREGGDGERGMDSEGQRGREEGESEGN